MVKKSIFIITLISLSIAILYFYRLDATIDIPIINEVRQVEEIFNVDGYKLNKIAKKTMEQATSSLNSIINIQSNKRTFKNTIFALDRALANFKRITNIMHTLVFVSPKEEIRKSANSNLITLQNFSLDNFVHNQKLYEAILYFIKNNYNGENLNNEQKYFIKELMDDFKRAGLQKSQSIQDEISQLEKKIAVHELNFQNNINCDNRFILVSLDELVGLDNNFIKQLSKVDNKYKLPIDSSIVTRVLDDCDNENTRKNLWKNYVCRGYPANEQELLTIINLRDKLAKLLDFSCYSEFDIANQMASNVKTVENFLKSLVEKTEKKVELEIKSILSDLPASIMLSNGKIKPWDINYIKNYKKKKFSVNEAEIAEFFPFENTLKSLFNIYEKFLGVKFVKIDKVNLWHETVEMVSVYKDGKFLGYVILDLFPRENKYNHACQISICPTVKSNKGYYPALILLITNFPKGSKERPSLLKRDDVITFFHEFGHALHSLLGATNLATSSGTQVKGDFVEMPSQMLEEWMWQPEIIAMTSSHYKTGTPLHPELIEKIIKIKNIDSGETIQGQICLAFTSLYCFDSLVNKDIKKLWKDLNVKYKKHVLFDEDNHRYCAFGHLMGYGAKYYGYLWSKVYALDLFDNIKKQNGILNNEIGQKYIDAILSKGGSRDPMECLNEFLGREPNSDSFFRDLGIA